MLLRPVLMPILRNPLQGIADGIRNMLAELLGSSQFFAPLTHSLVLARGTGSPTFTRASTATFTDWEGVLRTVPSGCARFEGARMVQNLWTTSSATLANGANKSLTLATGDYTFSMGAGTGTATFSGTGGATGTLAASASGRVEVTKTITAGTFVVTASVADLVDLQVEYVTGQADQTASEYVSVGVESAPYYHGSFVDGVKCFPTDLSGNPIAASTMLGYQAEGARTNLCLQSQAFDNASWTNTNVTVTANAAVAPDGTTTADLLYPASSGVDGDRRTLQAVTSTTVTHTVSFYLKYAGFRWVMVSNTDAGASDDKNWFDVQNGVVGTIGAGTTSMSAVSVGNGWYRVSVTATNATTNCYAWVSCVDGNGSSTVTASGTNGVYAWGAQVELGSFASSYIATTTAAVTRAADVDSVPTASNILAAASTVCLEFTPDHTPSGTIALWGTYVDASNYTAILHDATNMIMRKRIAGVNYDATIANAFSANTTYKVCGSWGTSGVTVTLDGTEGTASANTTAAQIAATMQIGADGNGLQQPFAALRNVRVWQRQVSEAERISITGPLDAAYLLSSPIDSAVVIAAGAPAYSVGAMEIDSVAAGNGSVEIISNWSLT